MYNRPSGLYPVTSTSNKVPMLKKTARCENSDNRIIRSTPMYKEKLISDQYEELNFLCHNIL